MESGVSVSAHESNHKVSIEAREPPIRPRPFAEKEETQT